MTARKAWTQPRPIGGAVIAKTCLGCGDLKMAQEFPITGSNRSPDSRCKGCHASRQRNRRQAWRKHVDWKLLVAMSCRECGRLTDKEQLRFRSWLCRPCDGAESKRWAQEHKPQRNQVRRRTMRALQATTLETATRSRERQQWTGPELELLGREDLTTREMAEALGRTYYAVQTQRGRLHRREPRQVYLAGLARG